MARGEFTETQITRWWWAEDIVGRLPWRAVVHADQARLAAKGIASHVASRLKVRVSSHGKRRLMEQLALFRD